MVGITCLFVYCLMRKQQLIDDPKMIHDLLTEELTSIYSEE